MDDSCLSGHNFFDFVVLIVWIFRPSVEVKVLLSVESDCFELELRRWSLAEFVIFGRV